MSHRPTFAIHIEKSWAHSFSGQPHWWNLSWKHVPTALHSQYVAPSQQSSPQAISHGFLSVHDVVPSVSLPPNRALPELFPTASFPFVLPSLPSHSLLTELSPSYFPRFPFRSWCRRPSQRSLPKLFPTVSFPFMMSSLPSRSLPTDLSPSYFPRFPFRSWYRRFRLAPSQRSSPQAISHGFLSVHDVVPSVSLHPRQRKLNENPSIGDTFGKKTSNRWRPSFLAQVARWLHLSGSNSTSEGVIDELLKGQSIFCRRSLRQLCSQLLLTSAMAQPG